MPTARHRPERKQRQTVNDYLNEIINYGGELRSRGSVMAEMQREGTPQRYIDAYMMGARTVRQGNPLSAGQRDRQLLKDMEELYRRVAKLRADLHHDISKDEAQRSRPRRSR